MWIWVITSTVKNWVLAEAQITKEAIHKILWERITKVRDDTKNWVEIITKSERLEQEIESWNIKVSHDWDIILEWELWETQDENNKLKELIKKYIIWRIVIIIENNLLHWTRDDKLKIFKPFVLPLFNHWLHDELKKVMYKICIKNLEELKRTEWQDKYYVSYIQYLLIRIGLEYEQNKWWYISRKFENLSETIKIYDKDWVNITGFSDYQLDLLKAIFNIEEETN